ncbi:RagB/SusD family nutrient uptake outer membrane protein [Pontibacter harenae]|uniref:RagB/SusD family nutrient uptake outer membrane protein n=1 Tax=Pontibacter harenae TaxID=2894083 RepID=UPI001E36D731|nr:RagB/SusD family nutrient uptake outer membrane protein [Pontibacter harenae]MCC9167592.1 RagB/SusD family nutrient uptake outer membrane protein [Pontibacter harenae]
MKKIQITIALASLLMVSCEKEFIEKNPVSTVSVDVLYKTDKDFNDATIGVYNSLQAQYQNFWHFGDLRGDDSWQEVAQQQTQVRVDNFTLDNNEGVLVSAWSNYYQAINRANSILVQINEADPDVVVNKDLYTGEAKFLRALAYFDLVRIFGDVPIVTRPLSISEAYKFGRESVDKVYEEVIIQDLMEAEANLPNNYAGTNLGRATKGAAKALLGKVYLTRGDFPNAEAKLQEVTTMGYSLLENYNDLFDYTKDEHHSEYIFDIEYEEGLGGEGSVFTNRFSPLIPEVTRFYGITGTVNDMNFPTEELFSVFEPGDLRQDVTAARGVTDQNGNFIPLHSGRSSFTRKYMTSVSTGEDSRANWKVIRYADVLLMYAEALNENGKTQEALEYLNRVRERAGLAGYESLSQSEARDMIYLERRLELSFEGHRWFDLVRTGQAYDVMAQYGMQPYMTLFPIPQSQVNLINDRSIFPQNPGYD